MTELLGIIQFILISSICYIEYKKKSSMLFLWGTVEIMFGVMHLLACFVGDSTYSNDILDIASGFVILYCLSYIAFRKLFDYIWLNKTKKITTSGDFDDSTGRNDMNPASVFQIVFVLSTTIYIVYAIYNSGGFIYTSWGTGGNNAITNLLITIYYPTSGALYYALVHGNKRNVILDSFLIVLLQIVTRNRVLILPLFISFFAYYFVYKTKKITLKIVIPTIIFAAIAVYAIYAIRALRWFGSIGDLRSNFSWAVYNDRMKYFFLENDGELGLRRYFYYFIKNNNNFENFGKGHTYIRMLLCLVPTSFSGGLKPPDFAISMGSAIRANQNGFSMHPTFFGDLYANFGFWGFWFSFFWALFARLCDSITSNNSNKLNMLFYCLFSTGFVVIGRGSVYNGFSNIIFGMIVVYFMKKIHFKRIRFKIGKAK